MIVCAGEALIDMLPRTTETGENAFAPHAGGAVFNTAIALGRLGRPTGFVSGISTDFFGDILRDTLHDSGVSTDLAVFSDRPTTLAFVRLVDGQASYAFYDEGTAGRMLEVADLPTLPEHARALFFGGISLVAEPCGSFYEALMSREAGRRLTMIDPNIRPGFIADEAAYRGRLERMVAMADIVKISDEDLLWLSGEGALSERVDALLALGPHIVCVTLGGDGAIAFTRTEQVRAEARKVEVVDTVGAGDTFNAGLLASLAEQDLLSRAALKQATPGQLRQALDLAVSAAAVTVSRAGANPPRRDEL